MKYLMDSLQSYETGHSDALCPIQNEADRSFMGEHHHLEPVSRAEFHSLTSTLVSTIHIAIAEARLPSASPAVAAMSSAGGQSRHQVTPVTTSVTQQPQQQRPPQPTLEADHTQPTLAAKRSQRQQASSPPALLPRPGIFIKHIKPGPRAWLEAVQQWEDGEPESGIKPLKDWEPANYQGVMRTKVAAKRQLRELFATEYHRCVITNLRAGWELTFSPHFSSFHSIPEDFEAAYPQARRGIKALVEEIRRRNNRQRKSRNGTPEERSIRAAEAQAAALGVDM